MRLRRKWLNRWNLGMQPLFVPLPLADETAMDVFVARQPIFDRSRELYAYELLFRSDDVDNRFDGTEAGSATTQVIANSLLTIGLENVAGGKKAFLNFDDKLLLGGLHTMLPREEVVLEILESVGPSDELIAACYDLNRQGYTFALDDFVGGQRLEPLTQIAKIIKVDMRATSKPDQERLLETYRPRGITMLAEKVETPEEFEWAKNAGYDYFQGYFFARPAVLRAPNPGVESELPAPAERDAACRTGLRPVTGHHFPGCVVLVQIIALCEFGAFRPLWRDSVG